MLYERVPTESWPDIVAHYQRNYGVDGWNEEYRPMVGLVEAIAASPYSSVLFGKCTSPYIMDHRQGQLDLSRTRELIRRHQMLSVSYLPEEDWFLFEYYEATWNPEPWATACASSEGFAKLEWVLCKRLRWFRRPGPQQGSSG